MKSKVTYLVCLLSVSTLLHAQSPAIQWQNTFGGTSSDQATSMEVTSDGGYILGGYSVSKDGDVTGNHGDADYWVVKTNTTGALQWQKSLGGTKDDFAESVVQSPDGSYLVAGYSISNDGNITSHIGKNDYWVAKLSSSGTLLKQISLGGSKMILLIP
jgi:hypothetical protein